MRMFHAKLSLIHRENMVKGISSPRSSEILLGFVLTKVWASEHTMGKSQFTSNSVDGRHAVSSMLNTRPG